MESPFSCLKKVTCMLLAMGMLLLTGCLADNAKQTTSQQQVEPKILRQQDNGITFSEPSGVYHAPELNVRMSAPVGYTIAYTTNGQTPTAKFDCGRGDVDITLHGKMSGYLLNHKRQMLTPDFYNSVLYESHELPVGVVLSAALVDRNGEVVQPPRTMVYFLMPDRFEDRFPGCMVLSVTTDPENLLDYHKGILAPGAIYDAWKQTPEGKQVIAEQEWWKAETNSAQHGKKWERPCQVQFYTTGEQPVMELDAGLRVRGGMSRRQNQKSFTIYFRDKYGTPRLQFPLFDQTEEFIRFGLRNGGDDSQYTKFKDAMLEDMAKGGKYTVLHKRPAVLFLNGENWGPYSLDEVTAKNMMKARYGVDEKNLVVIKEAELDQGEKGDSQLYEDLQAFGAMDLRDPKTFRQFCNVMDVQSMADYFALQVYIGNADCSPQHNHILWRTRDTSYNGGRWQYILHDLDYSAGQYDERVTAAKMDHLTMYQRKFPVFAAALKNPEFYDMFLNSLKKMGKENFAYDRVKAKMAEYDKRWGPLMPDFYERFGDTGALRRRSMNAMLNFFQRRYDFIIPIAEKARP